MTTHDREPEFFDTHEVPDTPEHWDAFAERVARNISKPASSVEWLARSRAGWVGGLVALAASVVFLVAAQTSEKPQAAADEWTRALSPSDSVARIVLVSNRPPRLEALLFSQRAEKRR